MKIAHQPNRAKPSTHHKVRVFISYSSSNLKLAEAVHAALEVAGFDVWRDKKRIEKDWSAEIAAALTQADLLCLLWTKEAVKSAFVQNEWLTARALEKAIVPCLLPHAPKLPQPIENLQGVVLSGKRHSLTSLIKYVRSRTVFRTKYDFRAPPINGFMPFAPDENFIGREQNLLDIYSSLLGQLNKIGFSQVGVVGMGGVGKTQLTVEFAHRFGFAFDGVYWIQGTEPRQLADELVRLARDRLGLKISHPKSPDASSRYLLELLSYSKAHPQMLLVIDNVADPSILLNTSTLPGGSFAVLDLGCGLLFSTRKQFQLKGVQPHLLDVLAPEAAVRLLTGNCSDLGASDRGIAEQICNAVGFLPLALALIAAYLRTYPQVTLAHYLENLRRNHLGAQSARKRAEGHRKESLIFGGALETAPVLRSSLRTIDATKIDANELATRHEAAVGTTLRSQWKMLKAPDARLALKILAHLPEGTIIPSARIGLLTGLRDRESSVQLPLSHAINALAELSLVAKVGDAAVRVHPLIADFVREAVADRSRADLLSAAAMKLKAAYRDRLRLNAEFEARGIDQVIGDLDIAVTWSNGDGRLAILDRLLDRERANLRFDENRDPKLEARFFQQLHQRAAMLGLPQLASEFLQAGRKAGQVVLRVRGSSAAEDLARVRTFGGRHSPVIDLAISADGERLVTASAQKLTLYDVATGQILRVIKGHKSIITAVAISPDGLLALSGGWDKKLICWDLATGEKLWQAQDHGDDIHFIAVSADFTTALTGSLDKTLIRWDVSSGRRLSRLEGHQAGISKGSISHDGRYAVSADTSGEIVVWDLRQEKALYQFQLEDAADGIKRQITALQLSPDARVAAIATGYIGAAADWLDPDQNGRLLLWDLDRRCELRQFKGHAGVVQTLAFSHDGRQLFSGSADKTCKLWDPETARCKRTFIGHSGEVTAAAFASGDRYAVSSGWDGDSLLWELAAPAGRFSNPPRSHRAIAHSLWVRSADISEDGAVALTGSDDKSVIVWNAANGTPVRTLQGHGEAASSVKLTADAANAVSGDKNGELIVWDIGKGEPIVKIDTRKGRIHAVNISVDKRTLFTGSNFSWVIAWDASTREMLRGFTHPKASQEDDSDGITAIVVSDDGITAISAGEDSKKLLEWDLQNHSAAGKVATFKGHSGGVLTLDRSSDGKKLLSGSSDCTAILWDVKSRQPLLQLKGHSGPVSAVAIASDRLAVTASLDNTLILWDLRSGEPLTRLFFDSLLSAAAARGKRVVLADRGGGVYFFEIEFSRA